MDYSNIKICAIAAMAKNRVIGRDNALIWHLPEDLKHFKNTTMDKPIIMGRKSYQSLGKPLPGRANIVVSRTMGEQSSTGAEGPYIYKTLECGIEAALERAHQRGLDEIFVIGGGEIYRQAMPMLDRIYLTVLDRDYEGDTVFPDLDLNEWKTVKEEAFPPDETKDRPAFKICVLER